MRPIRSRHAAATPDPAPRRARRIATTLAALAALAALPTGGARAAPPPQVHLRVVGGLAGIHQFTRHEEPFWKTRLAQLSGGRYSAELISFDRAGIRGQDMLSLVGLGAVPFGTVLLGLAAQRDQVLGAPDLAGLNPDMASLRRSVAAFRPQLEQLLRERHGSELLAVYAYPAQVVFCNRPLAGLADLRGRRVRTSSAAQSDWIEALGGQPLVTPFPEVAPSLRAGSIDCAITGTMTGHTVGLHELTTHLLAMPVSWGVSVFVANRAAWDALPADLRTLLRRELRTLEAAIWDEADRETAEGIACNSGGAACRSGRRGRMTAVPAGAADEQRQREIFRSTILPRWLDRCGPGCAAAWNATLAPATGIAAPTP